MNMPAEWIQGDSGVWDYRIDGEPAYPVRECYVYQGPSTFWAGRAGLGHSFATLADAKMTVEHRAAGRGACPRWHPRSCAELASTRR